MMTMILSQRFLWLYFSVHMSCAFTIVPDKLSASLRYRNPSDAVVCDGSPSVSPNRLPAIHPMAQRRIQKQNTGAINTQLAAWRLIGKYFQIEEMEDRDSCTTEVILNLNNTVTPLETNGPLHKEASGTWNLDPVSAEFVMTLSRTYEAGYSSKIPTNVGVFSFTTVRKFVGRLYNIGVKQGISGNIYDISEDDVAVEDLRKVGFFEMIDSTLSEDGGVALPVRARSS
jgi:hypothetical protein